MYPRRSPALLALLCLSLLFVAGCGDDTPKSPLAGKSESEVQQLFTKSMADVESVRLSAITQDGGERFTLDMRLDQDSNCDGSISIDDSTAEIRGDETWTYLKGNEAFWLRSAGGNAADAATLLQLIDDKWVRQPASGLADLCNLDDYLDGLTAGWEAGEFTVGDLAQADGVDTVKLTSAEGNTDGSKDYIWIEAQEPHRIVKMKGGQEPGEYAFSKYDEPVKVELPAKDEWVALSDLNS